MRCILFSPPLVALTIAIVAGEPLDFAGVGAPPLSGDISVEVGGRGASQVQGTGLMRAEPRPPKFVAVPVEVSADADKISVGALPPLTPLQHVHHYVDKEVEVNPPVHSDAKGHGERVVEWPPRPESSSAAEEGSNSAAGGHRTRINAGKATVDVEFKLEKPKADIDLSDKKEDGELREKKELHHSTWALKGGTEGIGQETAHFSDTRVTWQQSEQQADNDKKTAGLASNWTASLAPTPGTDIFGGEEGPRLTFGLTCVDYAQLMKKPVIMRAFTDHIAHAISDAAGCDVDKVHLHLSVSGENLHIDSMMPQVDGDTARSKLEAKGLGPLGTNVVAAVMVVPGLYAVKEKECMPAVKNMVIVRWSGGDYDQEIELTTPAPPTTTQAPVRNMDTALSTNVPVPTEVSVVIVRVKGVPFSELTDSQSSAEEFATSIKNLVAETTSVAIGKVDLTFGSLYHDPWENGGSVQDDGSVLMTAMIKDGDNNAIIGKVKAQEPQLEAKVDAVVKDVFGVDTSVNFEEVGVKYIILSSRTGTTTTAAPPVSATVTTKPMQLNGHDDPYVIMRDPWVDDGKKKMHVAVTVHGKSDKNENVDVTVHRVEPTPEEAASGKTKVKATVMADGPYKNQTKVGLHVYTKDAGSAAESADAADKHH